MESTLHLKSDIVQNVVVDLLPLLSDRARACFTFAVCQAQRGAFLLKSLVESVIFLAHALQCFHCALDLRATTSNVHRFVFEQFEKHIGFLKNALVEHH